MGVKMLQCFPWYRRSKERGKGKQCPPVEESPKTPLPDTPPPSEEHKQRLSSTTSWGSDGEGGVNGGGAPRAYFSSKARLSFRHQLDSSVNAVDATY